MTRWGHRDAAKDRVNRLVDIWLDGITSISNDAGWEGDSFIAKFLEYGVATDGSGRDQSNVSMINAIKNLRAKHFMFPLMHAVMLTALKPANKPHYVKAIVSKRFYIGTNQITNKPFSDSERAHIIGQTIRQFYHNLESGYSYIWQKIQEAEEYELLKEQQ